MIPVLTTVQNLNQKEQAQKSAYIKQDAVDEMISDVGQIISQIDKKISAKDAPNDSDTSHL